MLSRSIVSNSFVTPWTASLPGSLSVEFCEGKNTCTGGLPFPSPGMLPTQGSNLHVSHLLRRHVDSLPLGGGSLDVP